MGFIMENSFFSWKRFKNSFFYAWSGIWSLFKKEQNLWIMLILAFAILLLAWLFGLTVLEKAILILTIAVVISAEILNTAVEFIFDKFHMASEENAKIATNIMAGFVLILSIASLVIGLLIFWPYIS